MFSQEMRQKEARYFLKMETAVWFFYQNLDLDIFTRLSKEIHYENGPHYTRQSTYFIPLLIEAAKAQI